MFTLGPMRTRTLSLGLALLATSVAAAPAGAETPRPTGRWLVAFKDQRSVRSAATLSAALSRAGVQRAGRGVPALGVATVRGSGMAIRALRRDPRVEVVGREWYRELRRTPNDPALHAVEDEYGGIPGGGPIQWALAREDFYRAWDVTTGAGARVGLIDVGIDAAHPEFAGKIASADSVGPPSDPHTDPEGHGTHVAGLACAATNNGVGVAGAGWGCKLNIVKLTETAAGSIRDEDIVDGIRLAADRGAKAISMSFGGGGPNAVLDKAIDYAIGRGAVLVSAASNDPVADSGSPASQLQPGDAANIDSGRGLVVTAAQFDDRRAGTGFGPQISLAAYGFFDAGVTGPPGMISTYPGTRAAGDLGCAIIVLGCPRRMVGGDRRYAYLQGTSMAVPQVAALAALVADLNPYLSVHERLRLLKQSARGASWEPELGWGIIDAGAALDEARRIDRVAPSSRARARKRLRLGRGQRRGRVRVRWSGTDPTGHPGLLPSGLRSYDLYMRRARHRYHRVRTRTRKTSARLRLKPGVYRFYTRARDRAGNREAKPRRADVRLVVRGLRP
jgi:serine protease